MKRLRETGLSNELEELRQDLELSHDISMFGAVGDAVFTLGSGLDGGTIASGYNNTQAIQEAVDRTPRGGILRMPPFRYRTTASIIITSISPELWGYLPHFESDIILCHD